MTSASPPVRSSRRAALRTFVEGALVVGVGGAVAFVRTRGYSDARDRPLVSFAPWESVVLHHAARRITASDHPEDRTIPTADELDVVGFVDAYVARMPTPMRRDLTRAILYLEQVAPLTLGLMSRFSELAADDQDRVLVAFEASPVVLLRGAFVALKSLVFMGYYRDARTWSVLGYGGPWIGRAGHGSHGAPPP